jgi:hypothetical protein
MREIMKRLYFLSIAVFGTFFLTACSISDSKFVENRIPENYLADVQHALEKSGDNHSQLMQAIQDCPAEQVKDLSFLLANMPERDLKELTAEFLLKNIAFGSKVLNEAVWSDQLSEDIYLNYVLPYVNLHERRDDWRADFYNRFQPLVKESQSPSEATLILNEKMWDMVNVHYSTKRPKADQSPYESIEAGMASCTGLSILLIDACRAVGVPARFVGVPVWADKSGNHSWVEIWDKGWHIIGAGEPGPLDDTWFLAKASLSHDEEWQYGIYATSFKKTDVVFPPLFDSTATYVNADIVTDRYSKTVANNGKVKLGIRLFDKTDGDRIAGNVALYQNGSIVEEGETRDETHDYNDFLMFKVDPLQAYTLKFQFGETSKQVDYASNDEKYQFLNVPLSD